MTNGKKLLLTYPNLYVCALYFDMKFVHLRDSNITYEADDKETCIKIPIDWFDKPYVDGDDGAGVYELAIKTSEQDLTEAMHGSTYGGVSWGGTYKRH